MGCCCRRLLFLALLLLPAGLGHGSPESPLIPIRPPLLWGGVPAKPDPRDVPTPAPGQPELPSSGDRTPSRPLQGDGHNASSPAAAVSPGPVPVSPTAEGPWMSPAPAPRTAHAASPAGSTTGEGAAASPSAPAVPSPPSSRASSHSSQPTWAPGTGLAPTPGLVSPAATRPPLLPKDVPSLGTPAVASSLAVEPTSPPVTVPSPTEAEATASQESTGVTVEEVPRALSAGSIVAITVTVIVVVVLVFGAAAYLKIRHSSYGRLLDDHDYGSWGNYNNPLYDDS
ncbi:prostate androgen-regulated mucin-like protein 1 [Passer montanus]|uniref:prostate androgen-regulated mucin-like protein 1 n=1 Tax=Passer montanus TaxID=9160 RepID=UPI00195FD25B|nr:prostate androgen-regulated mucin-like protein 1 [Passer montanus]